MIRNRILVAGTVQGVGFRPFIYHLAQIYQIGGWVANNPAGVEIEAEGRAGAVQAFISDIKGKAPPLAVVTDIAVSVIPLAGETKFVIKPSTLANARTAFVAPDVATCDDCRRELSDPADRRYGYPFINCTNCGPRYTIITDLPYDRHNTTMAEFVMCPACQAEYDNPDDRRFHAQPNACPVCGPAYRLMDKAGKLCAGDALESTRERIREGCIVAIKGIGGYHLACDARNEQAVYRLRSRKVREDKPFAVMALCMAAVKRQCTVSPAEEELLQNSARPIVLLPKGNDYNLADSVAPGNPYLGVMLPYAPVHWLLLAEEDVWVLTSGNISDEPIAYEDGDAWQRLAAIADYYLAHNRPIYRRADDSVVRVIRDQPYVLRRGRGLAPAPVRLGRSQKEILAAGGEQKNAFCLTRGNLAFMSSHIGDVENMATYQSFQEAVEHYCRLFAIQPQAVAYDLHPEYLPTKYAMELDLPKVGVQHHHAHIAAVLAEYGIYEQVIGVAFDGTGYGTDGNLWGGEILLADCRDFVRLAHCRYLPLPGGARAIKEPWRLAAWLLHDLYGDDFINLNIPFVLNLPAGWELVIQAARKNINTPLTSSAGRLFDAAAALIGVRNVVHYEGQAAVELELAADRWPGSSLPYDLKENSGISTLDLRPAFAALVDGLRQGRPQGWLAASFHTTLAEATVELVSRAREMTGSHLVALSGGVFQNVILLKQLIAMLEQTGFTVLLHRQVPTNDGGLALGQAVIAGERLKK